jgi:mannose-6-phosphate isomerase-like protein (cupin superfamily)
LLIALLANLAAAQAAPPQVQWFTAKDRAAMPAAKAPFLLAPTLSCTRVQLASKATDAEHADDLDTVYSVVAGAAKLTAGAETRAVGKGDLVFVAAGVGHHFTDVSEALEAIAFRSQAHPTRGGMAGHPQPTKQTSYDEGSERGCARIFYWFGPDSAGQLMIDHGQPLWQDAFSKFMQKPAGRRWRLGENFWTTLDTNMPLQLGGVDVPIGQYYCVLENVQAGPRLVLLDPQAVRKQRLDAFEAPKTTGGILVPMTASTRVELAGRLRFLLEVDGKDGDRATLRIRFGPHELTAPVVMHPDH